MAGESESKINSLLHVWPSGTVAVIPWLETQGVYQQLAYEYEKAGWLRRIGRGAYARLNDNVEWTGALYAIQALLKFDVHVAAKTALELKGFRHFIPAGSGAIVYIFGPKGQRLPAWFRRHTWQRSIQYYVPNLFKGAESLGITSHNIQTWGLRVSAPERAIMEVLYLAPKEQSVEEAFHLMEGLTALRPDLVFDLLKACRSVKVKRLFLALADRCNHAWLSKLNTSRLKLGTGKRVIVPGGRLDKKYQITLPDLGEREEDKET